MVSADRMQPPSTIYIYIWGFVRIEMYVKIASSGSRIEPYHACAGVPAVTLAYAGGPEYGSTLALAPSTGPSWVKTCCCRIRAS